VLASGTVYQSKHFQYFPVLVLTDQLASFIGTRNDNFGPPTVKCFAFQYANLFLLLGLSIILSVIQTGKQARIFFGESLFVNTPHRELVF
jgi:hypothetical protein